MSFAVTWERTPPARTFAIANERPSLVRSCYFNRVIARSRSLRAGCLRSQEFIAFFRKPLSSCLVDALLILVFAFNASAQTVVDKTVLNISDGVRNELITYSDLLWQLALEPSANLAAPSNADLKTTLDRLTDQRLIALEAERLPTITPTDAEVAAEIRRLATRFASPGVLEARLRQVGFGSVDDPNFRRIIEQRVAIEKYLDFRFRAFVVITPDDEERYYREIYTPNFRRANPGVVVPPLDAVRSRINQQLTENRIEADINTFLKEARERAVVTTLNPI